MANNVTFHINNIKASNENLVINTNLKFDTTTNSYVNVNENDISLLVIIQYMRVRNLTELDGMYLHTSPNDNGIVTYALEL